MQDDGGRGWWKVGRTETDGLLEFAKVKGVVGVGGGSRVNGGDGRDVVIRACNKLVHSRARDILQQFFLYP